MDEQPHKIKTPQLRGLVLYISWSLSDQILIELCKLHGCHDNFLKTSIELFI